MEAWESMCLLFLLLYSVRFFLLYHRYLQPQVELERKIVRNFTLVWNSFDFVNVILDLKVLIGVQIFRQIRN